MVGVKSRFFVLTSSILQMKWNVGGVTRGFTLGVLGPLIHLISKNILLTSLVIKKICMPH